jgi:hypothetical protein
MGGKGSSRGAASSLESWQYRTPAVELILNISDTKYHLRVTRDATKEATDLGDYRDNNN